MAGFADWLAISNLKARYCRLLDGKDWAGFEALFTEDYVLDATGSGGALLTGRAAASASVRVSIEAARTVHHVHSPEITVNGDRACAIWAMQDRLVWDNGREINGAGHYHEDYRRMDGEWRIARLRLTRLMIDVRAAVGEG
jgi:hypothetical protein